MNLLIESLRSKWMQLQLRERQLLIFGGGLLLATSIYLSLAPQVHKYAELKLKVDELNADAQWMQQQRKVVERLINNCSAQKVGQASGRQQMTRLIRRNQLTLNSMRDVKSGLEFSMSGPDANRVISLTHQIACSGYDVKTLEIERSAEGLMKASMEVVAIED